MANALGRIFLRQSNRSQLQFDALDGLRAVAVAFVVASHLSSNRLHLIPGFDLSGAGKYGVYLFFVLSAFLLTRPLVDGSSNIRGNPRYWLRYAVRRVLRIFPLYVIVLAANLIATELAATPRRVVAFEAMSRDDFIAHVLLQQGDGIYWTIPVEFSYYLVLPFVAVLYAAVMRGNFAAVTGATLAMIAGGFWAWPPSAFELRTLHLGPYLPLFLCGSYAAYLDAFITTRGGIQSAALKVCIELAAVLCGLVVVVMSPEIWNALTGASVARPHFHRLYLLFGILWSVTLLGSLHGQGWLRRALSSKPLRILGTVSFSMYLWHMPVIELLTANLSWQPQLLGWVVFAAATIVSAVSFLLVEHPFTQSDWVKRVLSGPDDDSNRYRR